MMQLSMRAKSINLSLDWDVCINLNGSESKYVSHFNFYEHENKALTISTLDKQK